MMSSWNCSIVPLYFPVSPVPPLSLITTSFSSYFSEKIFPVSPMQLHIFPPRFKSHIYISLFSYSTYQGAPVPKSLVNANQELKFYSRIVFTSLCIYVYPLLFCIVFVLPYIPVPFYISPLLLCMVLVLPYIPVPFYIYPLLPCMQGLGTPIYPRTLLHISSTPLYRSCSLISIPVAF